VQFIFYDISGRSLLGRLRRQKKSSSRSTCLPRKRNRVSSHWLSWP